MLETLLPAELCPLWRPKEILLLPSVLSLRCFCFSKNGFTGDAGMIVIGGSAGGASSTLGGTTSVEVLGRADIVWFDIEP